VIREWRLELPINVGWGDIGVFVCCGGFVFFALVTGVAIPLYRKRRLKSPDSREPDFDS